MDLTEVETSLHDEARDHERRGDTGGARLLRAAGDLVAEARRADRAIRLPDTVRVDSPTYPRGGVPRRV